MRKIKKPKNNMDVIMDACEDNYQKFKKHPKIATVFYYYDRDSMYGCGGASITNLEELCFLISRIISNRAKALKMDPKDLLYMVEGKMDNGPEEVQMVDYSLAKMTTLPKEFQDVFKGGMFGEH